jgi:hypothetical protein
LPDKDILSKTDPHVYNELQLFITILLGPKLHVLNNPLLIVKPEHQQVAVTRLYWQPSMQVGEARKD